LSPTPRKPRRRAQDRPAGVWRGGHWVGGQSFSTMRPQGCGGSFGQQMEVKPLDGLWIYSVGRTDVSLQFDTSSIPMPPQKQLYTGWNAVGISGINQMSTRDSLISIGNNWNMVIGYHEGATPEDPIIRGSTDPKYSDTRMMYPTHGYWISMNANACTRGYFK